MEAGLCEESNQEYLQDQAVKTAINQQLINNSDSVTKIYISQNCSVVNFVVDRSVCS